MENAKIEEFKCDILGDIQTLWPGGTALAVAFYNSLHVFKYCKNCPYYEFMNLDLEAKKSYRHCNIRTYYTKLGIDMQWIHNTATEIIAGLLQKKKKKYQRFVIDDRFQQFQRIFKNKWRSHYSKSATFCTLVTT